MPFCAVPRPFASAKDLPYRGITGMSLSLFTPFPAIEILIRKDTVIAAADAFLRGAEALCFRKRLAIQRDHRNELILVYALSRHRGKRSGEISAARIGFEKRFGVRHAVPDEHGHIIQLVERRRIISVRGSERIYGSGNGALAAEAFKKGVQQGLIVFSVFRS